MAKETKDKIKDLIQPESLNELTVLVLVNAIYFKADWKHQFDKTKTEEKDFYLEGSTPQKVPMMELSSDESFELADLPSLKSKMLRLPYKGERIVLDILLPNAKQNREYVSVDIVEKALETTDILQEFESNKQDIGVDISLPKFKIESTHEQPIFVKAIKASGMTDMWCNADADFSGISSGRPICVSEVMQKLFSTVQFKSIPFPGDSNGDD